MSDEFGDVSVWPPKPAESKSPTERRPAEVTEEVSPVNDEPDTWEPLGPERSAAAVKPDAAGFANSRTFFTSEPRGQAPRVAVGERIERVADGMADTLIQKAVASFADGFATATLGLPPGTFSTGVALLRSATETCQAVHEMDAGRTAELSVPVWWNKAGLGVELKLPDKGAMPSLGLTVYPGGPDLLSVGLHRKPAEKPTEVSQVRSPVSEYDVAEMNTRTGKMESVWSIGHF